LGLSLAYGLAICVITLSITAFFMISKESFLTITVLFWLGFLLFIKKKQFCYGSFDLLLNLTSLILLLVPIFYVGYYLINTPWHAANDARHYGFQTSLLRYNGRNTMDLSPYSDKYGWGERGVSIIAANIAEVSGILNGKAIMVAGALAVILVPISLYAIMFSLTNKNSLSIIAALLSFNVYNVPYGMSIWDRFFTGNYGNVYGFFFLLLYIWFLLNSSQDEDKQFFLSVFFLIVSYFVYLGYLLHMLLFTFFLTFAKIVKRRTVSLDDCIKVAILIFPIFFVIMLSLWPTMSNLFPRELKLFLWPVLDRFSTNRLERFPQSIENPDYALNLSYFTQSVESILLIPSMIGAIISIFKKDNFRNMFSYFYIFISIIVTFYALSGLERALYFAPKRTALVANCLTYLMSLQLLYYYSDRFNLPKMEVKKFKILFIRLYITNKMALLNLCILLLLTSLGIFSLIPHLTYSYPQNKSYYVYSPCFKPNFKAALWIYEHATSTDLILDDMSFTGSIILSMGVFNLTYAEPISYLPGYRERAIDLWYVWINPYDEISIRRLLLKYNVTYILSDADWKILGLNMPELKYVTKRDWLKKPYSPSEISMIFDSYPFLEIVFKEGDARIYKVLTDKLENSTIIDNNHS
jgi:hypothetical protein